MSEDPEWRCSTCRWWRKHATWFDSPPSGICRIAENGDQPRSPETPKGLAEGGSAWSDAPEDNWITTKPEYGCVQWEKGIPQEEQPPPETQPLLWQVASELNLEGVAELMRQTGRDNGITEEEWNSTIEVQVLR